MSGTVLKKKIGKDDVIILNEKLIPHQVKIRSFHIDDIHFSKDTIYEVIGVSWLLFPDRTRTLGYILIDDTKTMDIFMTAWFEAL